MSNISHMKFKSKLSMSDHENDAFTSKLGLDPFSSIIQTKNDINHSIINGVTSFHIAADDVP
jgi:hypothetical protein